MACVQEEFCFPARRPVLNRLEKNLPVGKSIAARNRGQSSNPIPYDCLHDTFSLRSALARALLLSSEN
jgi:hypothetical protein